MKYIIILTPLPGGIWTAVAMDETQAIVYEATYTGRQETVRREAILFVERRRDFKSYEVKVENRN
jgi:hypothetical protein